MSLYAELKRRNVVRVGVAYAIIGWVLAQIAEFAFENFGAPDWVLKTFVVFLLLGLPIALFLAWAFELTPEGIKLEKDVDRTKSITGKTGRTLNYTILAGLLLLGLMLAWQMISTEPVRVDASHPPSVVNNTGPTEAQGASLAVLAFTDLSPQGDQEYFSDGIAEEILNVLVRVDELQVVSRTSAFQYKGRNLGIPEIAAALNVRHIVEGSVRKSGDTIRVTAQLIDAQTDKHLWSESYDRPLTTGNIFKIQDDIANSIVRALSKALGLHDVQSVEVPVITESLTAYELFLKARPLFQGRIDLDVADRLLAEAVGQDPLFAKAWELRAATQSLALEYGYTDRLRDDVDRLAIEFADRALAANPDSATAIAVKAKVFADANRELRARYPISQYIDSFSRALDLDPRNPEALNWRGLAYELVGELDSALRDFQFCLAHEPYYSPCADNQPLVLSEMRRDDAAMDALLKGLNGGVAKIQYAPLALLARRDEELLFKVVTNHSTLLFGWTEHDALYQAYRNLSDDHTALVDSIRAFRVSQPRLHAADYEYLVFPLGEFSVSGRVTLLAWGPTGDRFRQSPDFKQYMRDAGVYDYWLERGFPPQCRPLGEDDFECD